jgi:hypothetical protein
MTAKTLTMTMTEEDFRGGGVTESWLCVDCGVNTAPGVPTKAEFKAAFAAGAQGVPWTVDERCEIYVVRDSVWKAAGLGGWDGCLCIGCLEKRIGRRLKPKDFPDHFFNHYPGTPRLLNRQKRRPVRLAPR